MVLRKQCKCFVLMVVIISIVNLQVFANVVLDCNAINDTVTQTLNISGISSEQYVSVAVVKPNVDIEQIDLNAEGAIPSAFQMILNIKVKDGKYQYSYPFKAETGDYSVIVGDSAPVIISVLDHNTLKNILKDVNNATKASDIIDVINLHKRGIGVEWVDDYTLDENKLGVALYNDKLYPDLKSIITKYTTEAVVLIIGNIDNLNNSLSLLTKYENDLKLSDSISYEIFKSFDDNQKKRLISHICACDVKNSIEFQETFTEQVALTALENTDSYGKVEKLFKDYPNVYQFNIESELKKVKDDSAVYKGLKGKYFTSLQTLENELKNLVETVVASENKKNDIGKVGGGSSAAGSVKSSNRVGTNTFTSNTEETMNSDNDKLSCSFEDLEDYEWAKNSIDTLFGLGAIEGVEPNRFMPDEYATREQFVKIIVKTFGLKSDLEHPVFYDVLKDEWYADSIRIAYGNKIIEGIGENKFGIGSNITREDVAVIVYRVLDKLGKVTPVENNKKFIDSNLISDYAISSIDYMCSVGIINGYDDGTFRNKEYCTRAEMAKIIAGAYELGGTK